MKKRIEQLEWELKYKEEQLEDARKALCGTIEATGSLETVYARDGIHHKWAINISDILTKLIKEVGRLCDNYASDLFIGWNEIQKKLDNGTMRGDELYVFAIRDGGVDHEQWYENHKDKPNYYRAVWFLDIETTDRQIKMVLHK